MIPGSPATATMRRLLTELGAAGRTGALHVGGIPGGVLYLVAGRIAYAESPAAPSLAERLIGSGRLTPQTWRAAYAEGHRARRVGHVLLRDGWLGRHELAQRVASAIADATHALLWQADAPARFVPGERHWLGEVTRRSRLRGHLTMTHKPCDLSAVCHRRMAHGGGDGDAAVRH